jgi:hypothetical protein
MNNPTIVKVLCSLFFLLLLSCSTFSKQEIKSDSKVNSNRQIDKDLDKIKREKQELEYERLKRFRTLHDKGATDW